MKFPWTSVALTTAICLSATTKSIAYRSNTNETAKIKWTAQIETAVKPRLQSLDIPFEVKYTSEVKELIKSYVTSGYKGTQHILGRTTLYFPIFEHYLKIHRLPLELKYLPVVESRLKPGATSSVGAAGLWQFMPGTAAAYELKINRHLDERRDPYKSSEAAVKMLGKLYQQFGDWALVLAAYNCGPTRLRRAIRESNSRDFWTLRSYLPKETQRYVPAFIAAVYVDNYYSAHNLVPVYPAISHQDTRTFKVYKYMTFRDIAYKCKLDFKTLAYLNPGYPNGVLPMSTSGNFLVLPKHAAKAFQGYQSELNSNATLRLSFSSNDLRMGTHIVKPGDRIERIARKYNCTAQEIIDWNNLKKPEVVVGQELTLYFSKAYFLTNP